MRTVPVVVAGSMPARTVTWIVWVGLAGVVLSKESSHFVDLAANEVHAARPVGGEKVVPRAEDDANSAPNMQGVRIGIVILMKIDTSRYSSGKDDLDAGVLH